MPRPAKPPTAANEANALTYNDDSLYVEAYKTEKEAERQPPSLSFVYNKQTTPLIHSGKLCHLGIGVIGFYLI